MLAKKKDCSDVIGERTQRLYEEKIRSLVEPIRNGEFLVLDVEAEDYEVDADRRRALDRAEKKRPGGLFYILRI